MNKRFMSLLLVLVMVFSLLPISAMAEVYIFDGNDAIELDFYRKSSDAKPFNTQRVLTSGINAIYDPGCELAENTVFLGWQIDGQGETMDIAGVRNYVTTNVTHLAGKTVKLVASVSQVHYLVYNDESGRVVKTVAVILARNNNSWETDVDYDYIPASITSEFYGWKTTENGTAVEYENKSVEHPSKPTKITLSENTVNLYPVCRTGGWVVFDENDRFTWKGHDVNIHASYQAPAFVEQDGTVNLSDYTVSAQGWQFKGWYTEAGFTTDSDSGTQKTSVSYDDVKNLTDKKVTLYAHWEPTGTAEYKVAHWQQNANKDANGEYGYSLADVDTGLSGTPGDEAAYTAKTYDGFELNETKTGEDTKNLTIAGDGSTIRNVYYDRNKYTLHFYVKQKTVTIEDEGNDTHKFYLYKSDGTKVSFDEGTHNVSEFEGLYFLDRYGEYNSAIQNGSSVYYNFYIGTDYYYSHKNIETPWVEDEGIAINAKYGEEIFDRWPSKIGDYPATWRVGSSDSNEYASSCISMPLGGRDYYDNAAAGDWTRHKSYYLDPVDGNVPEFSAKYSISNTGEEANWIVAVPSEIEGFTFKNQNQTISAKDQNGTVSNVNMLASGDSWIKNSNAKTYTCNLYFTRNSYELKFYSNGSQVGEDQRVKYEAPISGYKPSGYVEGKTLTADKRYVFTGWYDNKDFAGSPVDFTTRTMPANNLTLYANWDSTEYNVVLALGDDVAYEGGKDFHVDYNASPLLSSPTRAGYEFVGWYTDPACTHRFSEGTHLTENTTDMNNDFRNQDRPSVVGQLTLYAKWRQEMDNETYLTVVYDAENGTINGAKTYTDPLHYADEAEAIAQPAAKSAVTGESFAYWEILKPKSATDPTLVPSGVTVYPGAIFNVKMDDAVSNTVTLRAHYEGSTGTHITWFGNGGTTAEGATEVSSADANLNAAISVKPADTFTREGYVFLGWARLNETDENGVKNPEVVDAKGNFINQNLTEADLWLTWDGEKYTAVNKAGETVTNPYIAANDIKPFHVLYAVWDKIDNHNYVIDFNGKMTIAASATAKKDDSHNNGAFEVADGLGTYQLKADEKDYTNGANLAFNGVDTALINGVPVGSPDGTTASWEKYTVIPANNVYFDDSLVGKSMTAGDGSGFNADVKQYETSPTAGQSQTKIEITFTGTGIDVYCTTPDANGWIQATVTKDNGEVVKQPYTNTKYVGGGELHNIPVISFRDLGTGTHTLVITTLTGANYKLDGIRVYNGMQDANETDKATVDTAYAAAKEQNLALMSVRSYLLSKSEFEKVTEEGVDENATVTGAVFIDTNEATTSVADYKAAGPKNEAYLASGQGVAFQIKGWATFKDTNKVMVGLSVPAGGKATVAASGRTGNNKIQLDAKTHMFYTITPDESGNVYIYNTGSAMVSVTDLKITGTKQYAAPATFTLGAPITPESEGGALTVSPKLLMRYVQDFDPEAVIEDPQVVDEPQTPENPDDGDKPGWNDNSYNPMTILKNLFQNLLNSLSSLFGGLGKW